MMPAMIRVFLDASVLFSAAYSQTGSARDLLLLAVSGSVQLVVSRFVLNEVEKNLTGKAPDKLDAYRALTEALDFELVPEPTRDELLQAAEYTALKDAPVVAAAIKAAADYLTTYDRKHLIDPSAVAERSGLRIVTPNVVVNAVREQAEGL